MVSKAQVQVSTSGGSGKSFTFLSEREKLASLNASQEEAIRQMSQLDKVKAHSDASKKDS